jgi:phage baseplate assembly protein W
MTSRDQLFGSDLRLLPDLLKANSRQPGHDLAVITRAETGQVDLEPVAGAENLQQALLLRFLTPLGALADLGHPTYGSRLFELLGELNNERTRNRAKVYVLEALGAEPRVKQVRAVSVTQSPADRTVMDIRVSLLAIDSATPLNFVFPFFLEGLAG